MQRVVTTSSHLQVQLQIERDLRDMANVDQARGVEVSPCSNTVGRSISMRLELKILQQEVSPSHLATHVQLCGDVDHGHPSTSEGLHATVQWAQAVVKVFDVSGQGLRVASTEILKY